MAEPAYSQAHRHHARPGLGRVCVAAAVVWSGDRILLTQRPPGGTLGLQWEFPGGKIEPGETPEHALAREICEELGVLARPLEVMAVETHDCPYGLEIEIHFLRCELGSQEFRPSSAVHAFRWVRPGEVDPATVVAADQNFLRSLIPLAR